jgi:hypothetical protein
MTDRASVTQALYLAAETSPGDGTQPDTIVNSFSLTPGAHIDFQKHTPTGQKLGSIVVPGKEWTEFDVTGLAMYSELHYLLACMFGPNQVSQPGVAGAVATWKFILSARQPDEVLTLSWVSGDENIHEAFNYAFLTDLALNMSRDGIEITGAGIGRELTALNTIPHAPSSLPEAPIIPKEISVYLDDTYGAIGSTKLTRALMLNQVISNRQGPIWVLDAAEPSYVGTVELAPAVTYDLTVEANTDGMGILDHAREGDTLYMKTTATSPTDVPTSATAYSYEAKSACKVSAVNKFEDKDGVYAIQYTLDVVYDSENDLSLEMELVNGATGF